MVSIHVVNGTTINADGVVELSDGRLKALADISGTKWNKSRIGKLTVALQAIIDDRRLIADLEDIDPDKTHALAGDDAWFLSTYGGRMFIDGDSVVSRSDLISFTFENDELVPHLQVVQ